MKKKYYVVWQGKNTGVFDNWNDCKKSVDGFEGAKYKSFSTSLEAQKAFQEPYQNHIKKSHSFEKKKTSQEIKESQEIIWESISVDAACGGNPGKLEYRGVHTKTKEVLFHQSFEEGTNNLGEFLAIVFALAMQIKQGTNLPIYTDSMTALSWVRNKKTKTTLERNENTEALFKQVDRAILWLENNTFKNLLILKWNTKKWGEIPADFGRK
jgi:ribonuclease HI